MRNSVCRACCQENVSRHRYWIRQSASKLEGLAMRQMGLIRMFV